MTNCFAHPHVTVKSKAELVGWFVVSAPSHHTDVCSGDHFLHLLGEIPQLTVSAGSELKVLYKSITVAH